MNGGWVRNFTILTTADPLNQHFSAHQLTIDDQALTCAYNATVHGGRRACVGGVVNLDPATVRAVAEQVQKLLEDIVRESPDHPWL